MPASNPHKTTPMKKLPLAAYACMAGLFFCSQTALLEGKEDIPLVQYSTLDALLAGHYDGVISLESLRSQGNHGIGTFDALDGEMVLYDGVVYQVRADGTVSVPEGSETSPFASVNEFVPDMVFNLKGIDSFNDLKAVLDEKLGNVNCFYAIEVKGTFSYVHTRSVPAQEKPYKPLADVVLKQPEFTFENTGGIILGYRCPDLVKGINVPGYHLHFLNDTHDGGGHLLDLSFDDVEVSVQQLNSFHLNLPDTEAFAHESFSGDTEEETRIVEGQ